MNVRLPRVGEIFIEADTQEVFRYMKVSESRPCPNGNFTYDQEVESLGTLGEVAVRLEAGETFWVSKPAT